MNTLKHHASEELAKSKSKGILSRSFIRTRRRREENTYDWKRNFSILLQERKQYDESLFRLEFELSTQEVEDFKEQFSSHLNGTLSLEIKIGRTHKPQITVVKQGKGSKSLSSKSGRIAAFIGERINFTYIPAVRTDEEAFSVVQGMISEELSSLEKNPEYQEALKKIEDLQKPVLEKISKSISEPLTNFLPQIKSVKVVIPEGATRVALRDECEILVDDGTETSLALKGDGVKSLAALGLLKEKEKFVGASIIAMEEPESHLHPGAIHQLRNIIYELAEENQIILTTHWEHVTFAMSRSA